MSKNRYAILSRAENNDLDSLSIAAPARTAERECCLVTGGGSPPAVS